jgi:hypothetical protein
MNPSRVIGIRAVIGERLEDFETQDLWLLGILVRSQGLPFRFICHYGFQKVEGISMGAY